MTWRRQKFALRHGLGLLTMFSKMSVGSKGCNVHGFLSLPSHANLQRLPTSFHSLFLGCSGSKAGCSVAFVGALEAPATFNSARTCRFRDLLVPSWFHNSGESCYLCYILEYRLSHLRQSLKCRLHSSVLQILYVTGNGQIAASYITLARCFEQKTPKVKLDQPNTIPNCELACRLDLLS
jgi:hypothetical protein